MALPYHNEEIEFDEIMIVLNFSKLFTSFWNKWATFEKMILLIINSLTYMMNYVKKTLKFQFVRL